MQVWGTPDSRAFQPRNFLATAAIWHVNVGTDSSKASNGSLNGVTAQGLVFESGLELYMWFAGD